MNHQTLQRSHYNYFVEREECIIGYNARTGAVALLSQNVARILRENETITISDIRELDVHELISMGFLHSGDEVEQVLSKFEEAKYQKKILNFTILPTLLCNFSCDYCFQGGHENGQTMLPETQVATLDFIQASIASGQEFTCTWFGGEPLIAKSIVLSMSQQIKRIADKNKAHLLHMNIVTNAILLNSETAKELGEAGVKQAQVSFDALVFKNSKKRGVIDSVDKPSLILKNIIAARKYLDIRIRVNVSSENIDEVPQIVEILSQNGFANAYYIDRIHDNQAEFNSSNSSHEKNIHGCETGGCGTCGSIASDVKFFKTLSRSAYARFEEKFSLDHPEVLQAIVQKLVPRKHFCGATLGSMFVIDPSGYLSRCWHSAGSSSEAMENVHSVMGSLDDLEISRRWREFTPFAYPACRNCRVLPLCMGGCSHPRMFMNATKPPCESIKDQIQFCVNTVGRNIEITPDQQAVVLNSK